MWGRIDGGNVASRQAVAEAFAAHRGRVESVAAGILRDPDEARDIASDAFLALLERGPSNTDSTKAWLMVTARNRALNRARDLGRARQAQELAGASETRDQGPSRETMQFLAQAMRHLPARYASALRLRYMEDQDYPEIATALCCTDRQARIVVYRAARRLRREIILLLAEHRGASSTCRRLLLAGLVGSGLATPLHKHCDVCAAVSEDLAELRMHGWLPLAPAWIPAMGRYLENLVASVGPRLPRLPVRERVAEALTALLLTTGSFGAATIGPPPLAATSATGSVVQSDIDAGGGRHGAASQSGQGGTQEGKESGGTGPAPGSPAPGTGTALPDLPLVRPDSVNPGIPAPADIVSFSIETERGADGSPRALHARVELAAPASQGTTYQAAWGTEGGCTASVALGVDSGVEATVHCPGGPLAAFDARGGFGIAEARVRGRSVHFTIPLAADGGLPGITPSGGIIVRTLAGSSSAELDRAPDSASGTS